jgi:hypothetical protein
MRIFITVAPLMYREVFALAIHDRRPDIEVLVGPEASLDGQAERFAPHLLVRNDTDGADMEVVAGALCWVEILYSDSLNARVSLDGKVWEIEDICIDDLISLIEQTERLIPEDAQR